MQVLMNFNFTNPRGEKITDWVFFNRDRPRSWISMSPWIGSLPTGDTEQVNQYRTRHHRSSSGNSSRRHHDQRRRYWDWQAVQRTHSVYSADRVHVGLRASARRASLATFPSFRSG